MPHESLSQETESSRPLFRLIHAESFISRSGIPCTSMDEVFSVLVHYGFGYNLPPELVQMQIQPGSEQEEEVKDFVHNLLVGAETELHRTGSWKAPFFDNFSADAGKSGNFLRTGIYLETATGDARFPFMLRIYPPHGEVLQVEAYLATMLEQPRALDPIMIRAQFAPNTDGKTFALDLVQLFALLQKLDLACDSKYLGYYAIQAYYDTLYQNFTSIAGDLTAGGKIAQMGDIEIRMGLEAGNIQSWQRNDNIITGGDLGYSSITLKTLPPAIIFAICDCVTGMRSTANRAIQETMRTYQAEYMRILMQFMQKQHTE